MNTQIKGNKSKLLTFAIAGKITVGTTSPNVKNKKITVEDYAMLRSHTYSKM